MSEEDGVHWVSRFRASGGSLRFRKASFLPQRGDVLVAGIQCPEYLPPFFGEAEKWRQIKKTPTSMLPRQRPLWGKTNQLMTNGLSFVGRPFLIPPQDPSQALSDAPNPEWQSLCLRGRSLCVWQGRRGCGSRFRRSLRHGLQCLCG